MMAGLSLLKSYIMAYLINNTFAYKNYQKLDPAYRQTNVALFPYLPVEKVPNKSFWSTYSDVNAVIFNQR